MNNVVSEEEYDPSPFTFLRRPGVQYRAPLDTMSNDESQNYSEAFHLTRVSLQGGLQHLGYCRRRLGRGGRVVLDRISTKFDNYLEAATDGLDPWTVRPLTPDHLEEDMDWDPYMVRDREEGSTEPVIGPDLNKINNNSGQKVFKIVDMNSAVAHNAAGALVDSQFVDLFSTPQLSSES